MPIRIAGSLLVALAAAAVALIAVVTAPRPDTALACTGGIGPFEGYATEADLIVLVQAIEVGDGINHAPTLTASATPTATATPDESITPSPTMPPAPTPYRPVPGPVDFDLTGIGATFVVQRVIVGTTVPTIEYQWDYRASIEDEIRKREAGAWSGVTSCPLGAFTVRYEQGRQYLLFFNEYEGSMNGWASFPVDDGQVVLDDPLHQQGNNGAIYASPETLARYLPGVRAEEGFVKQPRVPLDMALRAVAGLRGDPSIAPPETGTAGLKALSHRPIRSAGLPAL